MPMDVRDRPPVPGDGSGICERRETKRDFYERRRREAQAEHWEKKVAAYRAKYAFPFGINGASRRDISAFFGRVFGEEGNDVD